MTNNFARGLDKLRNDRSRTYTYTGIAGARVTTLDGEHLGMIQDLMIELTSGRVVYVVVAVNDDTDRRLMALPCEVLMPDDTRHGFIAGADRDRMNRAPGFEQSNWPLTPGRVFVDALHQHYGCRTTEAWGSASALRTAHASSAHGVKMYMPGAPRPFQPARTGAGMVPGAALSGYKNTFCLPASLIVGDEAVNANGDPVGLIDDVLVNLGTGRVSHILIYYSICRSSQRQAFSWASLVADIEQGRFELLSDVELRGTAAPYYHPFTTITTIPTGHSASWLK
jgi:sporulation protein YlmC with PRC-barrel domain